ncbi:hypothetical protein [Bacillus bombysepticus]|uniref:hypothetical protein n=1 Tax=Bacillus bombysepticus TaxID=658666 RepID=UPI00301640F7
MAAMFGTSSIQSGETCYAIDSGKVVRAVFMNLTENREYELRIMPDYEELVVKRIYTDYDLAQFHLRKDLNLPQQRNTDGDPNTYTVCEQCNSVTTVGKACECSRWA